MPASAAVKRTVVLPADRKRVWDAVTRPAPLSRWLGAEVEIDLRPGGTGTVVGEDETVRRLVVEEVVPGRRLTFHWWPADREAATPRDAGASTVEIGLDEVPAGTRVTVTEMAPANPAPAAAAAMASDAASASARRVLLATR